MQTVSAAWTAEERDKVRLIAQNLQVSWKKQSLLQARTFTIGVSTIGGNDGIGINPGSIGAPINYKYFDESSYLTSVGWDRALNMPTGGLVKALGEAKLDNTSGRFTPRYMGGNSELFTAILPRRPVIIGGGFNLNGVNQTIPVLAGTLTRTPEVDMRTREISLEIADYIDFFENRYVDRSTVFTAVTTDVIIQSLFSQLGMSTSQYDLDPGINVIPFASIDTGAAFKEIMQKLVESENGHMYQDESGIVRFENRQHWDRAPYINVQRIITTAQVIDSKAPDEDHLINTVEVKSSVREKAINQKIWSLSAPTIIPANGRVEIFADFTDDNGTLPVLTVDVPLHAVGEATTSAFATNIYDDNSGDTNASAIQLKSFSQFVASYKMVFTNSSSTATFITALDLWGRPAKVTSKIDVLHKRDASVTAYEEHPLIIENQFIQSKDWADSFAEMVLEDFSRIENLQRITIYAIPELQLGDLISWQGHYWRVYGIKSKIDPGVGFTQEIDILQRTIKQYFRIGISTIGGSDKIAP